MNKRLRAFLKGAFRIINPFDYSRVRKGSESDHMPILSYWLSVGEYIDDATKKFKRGG